MTAVSGDRKVLKIPCRFKATKTDRAMVERKVNLDLSRSQGLQFKFFCGDPSPISKFNFYLRSGRGWYAASFATDDTGGWNTILIDKGTMQKEGKPGGWDKIDAVRIAAWKGGDSNTEFFIADLGVWGEDAPILVVRGDWYVRKCPEESQSVTARMVTMTQNLRAIGAAYNVCSDLELGPELLKGRRLVVLPHNSEMPEGAVNALKTFLRSGGKLLSFYVLPEELRSLAGIKQGGPVRQEYTGWFASIRQSGRVLPGLPEAVDQRSWNIFQTHPVEGRGRVAAFWFSDKGDNTGEPAIVVSDNCIHMTHVLLSDDPAGKKSLVMAMTGRFVPELWRRAARSAIDQVGVIGPYRGKSDFVRAVGAERKAAAGVKDALDRAVELTDRAEGQYGLSRFVEALQTAEEAQRLVTRAYCLVQSPRNNERRLAWCHSPFGITGMDWDRAVGILADNGFTDLVANMCWAGNAYYESNVLPVSPEAVARGDQVKQCLAACRKHGIRLHVWRICWNMGWTAPKDFLARMKRDARTQVNYDGSPKDNWLCPSNPENQKLEIAAMAEIARNYEVDGVHFDYIRYHNSTCCFCQGCRERFERAAGVKVRKWPSGVKSDPALWKKWLEFRRQNINAVVAAASANARAARPGISVSAAVFSNWPTDRDDIGQDWKLWCDSRYVDFICPMDYSTNNRDFQTMVENQVGWAGKIPCYPGIGLSTWPPADRMARLVDQVNITRKLGTGGFTIFNYNRSEAEEVLPLCGLGLTKKSP